MYIQVCAGDKNIFILYMIMASNHFEDICDITHKGAFKNDEIMVDSLFYYFTVISDCHFTV